MGTLSTDARALLEAASVLGTRAPTGPLTMVMAGVSETSGVIGARLYQNHPPRYEYFLTDKGKALGPVLKALYNWGERYR